MNPIEKFLKYLTFLFSADVGDPVVAQRWRLLVSLLITLIIGHVLWAAGALSGIGLNGFATESQLQSAVGRVSAELTRESKLTESIQVTLLEQSIMTARSNQCLATHKVYFAGVIVGLEDQYFSLQGHAFPIPSCTDTQ